LQVEALTVNFQPLGKRMKILGIDVGGSGTKGALVDISSGQLVSKRLRLETPQPAAPQAVIEAIAKLVNHFEYDGPVGIGFPAIILDGRVMSAANIDDEWIGYAGVQEMQQQLGQTVTLLNDADAAGLAEMRFGAGRGRQGVVLVLTLGTGIGSALFVNGRLVPNTELGHLYLSGRRQDAEYHAAVSARHRENLSWRQWSNRLDKYLQHVEFIFSPHVIILGGGASKKHEKFIPRLHVRAEVVPAMLRNEAGIVGAALAAAEQWQAEVAPG
jgi:polyphosphate glucokinase